MEDRHKETESVIADSPNEIDGASPTLEAGVLSELHHHTLVDYLQSAECSAGRNPWDSCKPRRKAQLPQHLKLTTLIACRGSLDIAV